VKVRGFRIELGEIEAVLTSMDEVKQCHVVLSEDAEGDKRLVAYVVARSGQGQAEVDVVATLRVRLKAKLPDYMVPSAIMELENLPLTPNGKVDRKALPQPQYGRPEDDYVAPETPTEQKLAELWQQVLGLSAPVSRTANFFDLGGHSLSATRLMTLVREQFLISPHVKQVFVSPTLQTLANLIDESVRDAERYAAVRIAADREDCPHETSVELML
jgi:acyl carrier protein